MQLIEIHHQSFTTQFLEPMNVRVITDEDDWPVDLCLALLFLNFSQIAFLDQYLRLDLILFLRLLHLLFFNLPCHYPSLEIV